MEKKMNNMEKGYVMNRFGEIYPYKINPDGSFWVSNEGRYVRDFPEEYSYVNVKIEKIAK